MMASVAFMLLAFKDNQSHLVDTKQNIPNAKSCEQSVKATIGKTELVIPRLDGIYTIQNGHDSYKVHPQQNCHLKTVEYASRIRAPNFELYGITTYKRETAYQQYKQLFQNYHNEVVDISTDVRYLKIGVNEIYIYETLKQNTYSGDPVAFHCHKNICRASYKYNQDLIIKYTFTKDHFSDFYEADKSFREKIASLIVNTREKGTAK